MAPPREDTGEEVSTEPMTSELVTRMRERRAMRKGNPLGESLQIEAEILHEKSSGLGHLGYLLEKSIDDLKQIERNFEQATGEAREKLLLRHAEARAEAEKWRWYLIVQREAMGVRRNHDVYQHYPIPGPLPGEPPIAPPEALRPTKQQRPGSEPERKPPPRPFRSRG